MYIPDFPDVITSESLQKVTTLMYEYRDCIKRMESFMLRFANAGGVDQKYSKWIDTYYVGVTDDYEYLVVFDNVLSEFKIFRLIDYIKIGDLVKRISVPNGNLTQWADIYPDSHIILFNNGQYIVEYDIDSDQTNRLFQAESAMETPQYYRPDYSKIVCARTTDDKTIKIKNRNGEVERTISLAWGLLRGSLYFDGNVLVTTHAEGPSLWSSTGTQLSYIYHWWAPVHIHHRGGLLAVANEFAYGIMMEKDGVLGQILPMRSNIFWMMRDGLIYATYNYGLIVFSYKDIPNMLFPQIDLINRSLASGKETGRLLTIPMNAKANVYINSTQPVRIERFYRRPYNTTYGGIFWHTTIIERKTLAEGVTSWSGEFSELLVHINVVNTSATTTTLNIITQYSLK